MIWLEQGTDGYYEPKDDQIEPNWPRLFADREECDLFVRFILCDLGRRESKSEAPPGSKPAIAGIATRRSGDNRLRGTDRTLRVYVSVAAFLDVDVILDEACGRVAEWLEDLGFKFGQSKRGRKTVDTAKGDHWKSKEIVRSLYNRYHGPLKEGQLEVHKGMYRWWREFTVQVHETAVVFQIERVRCQFGERRATALRTLIADARKYYERKDVSYILNATRQLVEQETPAERESGDEQPPIL